MKRPWRIAVFEGWYGLCDSRPGRSGAPLRLTALARVVNELDRMKIRMLGTRRGRGREDSFPLNGRRYPSPTLEPRSRGCGREGTSSRRKPIRWIQDASTTRFAPGKRARAARTRRVPRPTPRVARRREFACACSADWATPATWLGRVRRVDAPTGVLGGCHRHRATQESRVQETRSARGLVELLGVSAAPGASRETRSRTVPLRLAEFLVDQARAARLDQATRYSFAAGVGICAPPPPLDQRPPGGAVLARTPREADVVGDSGVRLACRGRGWHQKDDRT